ncbi:MAG TPA: hypothetical protein PLD59_06170 [Tepidisphaeraceae bacterium]|nr:hypothetical protein [Tepidisphaeraceae bacterium]
MDRWLFETPWWLLSLVAVAAVALLVSGNSRQNSRIKAGGLGVLLLAAALWATSYFIETPRETATRQTREWVAAVVAKDSSTIDRFLHPKATLERWNRQDIVAGAVKYADQYGLESATVLSLQSEPNPVEVETVLSVLSRHDSKRAIISTINSSWKLIWVRTGDDKAWVIQTIEPLKIGQSERGQFRDDLFGRSPR